LGIFSEVHTGVQNEKKLSPLSKRKICNPAK